MHHGNQQARFPCIHAYRDKKHWACMKQTLVPRQLHIHTSLYALPELFLKKRRPQMRAGAYSQALDKGSQSSEKDITGRNQAEVTSARAHTHTHTQTHTQQHCNETVALGHKDQAKTGGRVLLSHLPNPILRNGGTCTLSLWLPVKPNRSVCITHHAAPC
eukprot:scaffold26900_cov23-Tisochrysis_lutea.AAC.2